MNYRCNRCKRALVNPAVQSGALVLGRVCARRLGVEIGARSSRPSKNETPPAPKRDTRQGDLFQWFLAA